VEFFSAPERQHAALRDDVGERGQRFRENRRGLEPHVVPQPFLNTTARRASSTR